MPNGWTVLANGACLIMSYRSPLTRLCYIALCLLANCMWPGHPLLGQILLELKRNAWPSRQETDESGRHWRINIAQHVITALIGRAIYWCFPTYFRTQVGLNSLVLLFFPWRHPYVQLWLQRQSTKLARFDRVARQWGTFIVESTCLVLIQVLDFPITKTAVCACWWVFRNVAEWAAERRWILVAWYPLSRVVFPAPYAGKVRYAILCCTQFDFWFRDLAKFANPILPTHKYTPLETAEDIRLLLLYPRFGFRPICCSLLTGPYRRLLFYEAISYKWSGSDPTEEILVDGCKMNVTKSVYEILASYSSLVFPKLLWIDAICIDQANEAEKSQQVPTMDRIYGNAAITTMWLGRSPLSSASGRSDEALMPYRYDGIRCGDKTTQKYLEDAHMALDFFNDFRILQKFMQRKYPKFYELFDMLPASKVKRQQWLALLKMFNHPVFERVWIVQEIALSEKVQVRYGEEVIDWEVLANGVEALQESGNFSLWLEHVHKSRVSSVQHTSLSNVVRMHRFWKRHQSKDYHRPGGISVDLPGILVESVHFKASNPRDLIYGLMSICSTPMNVSYSDSTEDVYINATKELITMKAWDLVFHAAGVGNRTTTSTAVPGLPSWVADWTQAPRYKRLQDFSKGPTTNFKAGGDLKPDIQLKENTALSCLGAYIDAVETLGPVLFSPIKGAAAEVAAAMSELALKYEASCKLLETSLDDIFDIENGAIRAAFRRTLLLEQKELRRNYIEQPDKLLLEWEEKLLSFHYQSLSVQDHRTFKLLESMQPVTELLRTRCGGRRLFVSKKGYFGLCPPYTQLGDLIYVLPGIHTPILLRRKGHGVGTISSSEKWAISCQLVGECFCNRLMYGEAVAINTDFRELKIL